MTQHPDSIYPSRINAGTPLSPPQRPPTVAPWEKYTRGARRLGRGKLKARGERWEGERKKERRPLPDFVRFSGRICGSVVLAKPDDDLDGFERPFKDLSIEG